MLKRDRFNAKIIPYWALLLGERIVNVSYNPNTGICIEPPNAEDGWTRLIASNLDCIFVLAIKPSQYEAELYQDNYLDYSHDNKQDYFVLNVKSLINEFKNNTNKVNFYDVEQNPDFVYIGKNIVTKEKINYFDWRVIFRRLSVFKTPEHNLQGAMKDIVNIKNIPLNIFYNIQRVHRTIIRRTNRYMFDMSIYSNKYLHTVQKCVGDIDKYSGNFRSMQINAQALMRFRDD